MKITTYSIREETNCKKKLNDINQLKNLFNAQLKKHYYLIFRI